MGSSILKAMIKPTGGMATCCCHFSGNLIRPRLFNSWEVIRLEIPAKLDRKILRSPLRHG
jgi:hypothetical protein